MHASPPPLSLLTTRGRSGARLRAPDSPVLFTSDTLRRTFGSMYMYMDVLCVSRAGTSSPPGGRESGVAGGLAPGARRSAALSQGAL